MRQVIILQGIPGSGKSTQAAKYAAIARENEHTCQIVSADYYFAQSGTYKFDFSKLHEAHEQCMFDYMQALEHAIELIIVDNTNLRAEILLPYINAAKQRGYTVVIYRTECDPDLAFKRNIHGAPLHTIQRMNAFMKSQTYPIKVSVIKEK